MAVSSPRYNNGSPLLLTSRYSLAPSLSPRNALGLAARVTNMLCSNKHRICIEEVDQAPGERLDSPVVELPRVWSSRQAWGYVPAPSWAPLCWRYQIKNETIPSMWLVAEGAALTVVCLYTEEQLSTLPFCSLWVASWKLHSEFYYGEQIIRLTLPLTG